MDRDRVVLAEVVRPRGIRGELLVISQTDVPGRMESLKRAQARLSDGSDTEIEIEQAWAYREDWVLKLAGVDSIDAAERFRRAEIWVPLAERAQLPEGEFFQTDLVGCQVMDAVSGECLGVVDGWQQYGGPALLEVTVNGREVLIPFVEAICTKVDLKKRSITVDLPEGLLAL